jgi:hypothetical protein
VNSPNISTASTVSVDRIILDGAELTFGSSIKRDYYYPLQNSDYYLGFVHAQDNHFSAQKIRAIRVGVTGCVNSHNGLWGIEDKKLFLLDLKPCSKNFDVKDFSNKVLASWVTGEFIVEHPEKSLQISCVKKSTYLLKSQKFYFLSIQSGVVKKYETINEDVVFNDHAFARFSVERYLTDPKLRPVILACD